LLY
jgi:hypothetical protein